LRVGPGLALNYWESMLKVVLQGDVPTMMKDFKADLR
jgi:hypothetical protein